LEKFSPVTLWKALKNEVELEGLRQAHIREAVALVNYFSWLEIALEKGEVVDECSGADKLFSFRREQANFVSLSFETISASGSNGAIIHYRPSKESCAKITKGELYLCDSGAQFRDGTTDVTRTVSFGYPTDYQKKCFTLVLKGVIGLDSAIFPTGTTGRMLDILARLHLWSHGKDYRHGTGHGVGAFLNVHEGPQGISFRDSPYQTPLEPGMTVTDEPGYYEDGVFGIRIENVEVVVNANTEDKFDGKDYYGFEPITLVPIQAKMIDTTLLSPQEIKWVNNYHRKCLGKIGPLLSGESLKWLERETKPLGK